MAYDFKSLTKQADEASNRGKFYTDFKDVDPNVLHQISDLTEWIRTKGKGSDVREIIAQLFERTWLEGTKEGNANMEVAKARGTAVTLGDRLQAMDGKISQTTTDITRTESRIDGLIANAGNGTVPSELTDMRVDRNGLRYTTAREAVVNQLDVLFDTLKTNNILTFRKKVNGYYCDGRIRASSNYYYIDKIPVKSGTTYHSNSEMRYVVLFNASNVIVTSLEKVREFTVTQDGYAIISYYYTVENPKLSESRFSLEEIDDYNDIDITVLNVSEKAVSKILDKFKDAMFEVNLFDKMTSTISGYLQKNGEIVSYETINTSDFIKVEQGKTYSISGLRKLLFYNIEKNPITTSFVDKGVTSHNFVASQNGYIRFSYYKTNEDSTTVIVVPDKEKLVFNSNIRASNFSTLPIQETSNILNGKKWYACGDSFTEWTTETFNANDYPNITSHKNKYYKTYPFWIGSRNNMIVHNFAVSGQTLATPSEKHVNTCFTTGFYDNIPADVDYITLWFGINDSHHRPSGSGGDGESSLGTIPLGTINDETINTFYGAWNVVLRRLITDHPYAKIGIIVSNGCETTEYPQATIECAKKWGIPYLDLNGDYTVPLMHRVNGKDLVSAEAKELRKQHFWADPAGGNGHPNAKAHEFQSTFIENWMRSL